MFKGVFLVMITVFFNSFSQTNYNNWSYAGPHENSYQFKGLFLTVWADESNADFVLAGSSGGGLFVTKNASSKEPFWENLTDNLPFMNFGVSGIVVKKNTNARQIYISTNTGGGLVSKNFGNGILFSSNGGKVWEQVGPKGKTNYDMPLNGLSVSYCNEDHMATYYGKDLYLTKNAWNNFVKISLPFHKDVENVEISDVVYSPHEIGVIYVCTKTYLKNKAQLFVSKDGGSTWKDITPPDVSCERISIDMLSDLRYKGRFYLAHGNADIYFKYFNGTEFSKNLNELPLQNLGGNSYWCMDIKVNQVDTNIVYFSMTETCMSTSACKDFIKIGFYNGANTHADVRKMDLGKSTAKGKNDRLYLANDGGISMNNDLFGSTTTLFRSLNGSGLNANQFWGIDILQSDSLFIAGGAQDNGGFFIKEHKENNNLLGCGDGYFGLPVNDTLALMLGNPPLMMLHNINEGISHYINIPDQNCEARRPMILKDSCVYVGYHDVWKIEVKDLIKYNFNFKNISNITRKSGSNGAEQNREIKVLCISKDNRALVAYANPNWQDKNEGKLYYCANILKKEPEYIDITEVTRNKYVEICRWFQVESIVADNELDNTFYMIYKDVFDQKNSRIYKLVYYPDSNYVDLTFIDYNLEKTGFNKLKFDNQTRSLYLAANNGVFRLKVDKDTNWTSLNFFPKVLVSDIAINTYTNKMFVSTFGRGIWSKTLPSYNDTDLKLRRHKEINEPLKVDGTLTISNGKQVVLTSKLILTKGSKIYLNRRSKLQVDSQKIVDENNQSIQPDEFIVKHKSAKLVLIKK
jgi:hypothetical protein